MIIGKQVELRKITRNMKGKVKKETVYQTVHGKYFKYFMNINGNHITELVHRFTGYVFEDNNGILNKKDCHHIDRFT